MQPIDHQNTTIALYALANQHAGYEKLILKVRDILHRNMWPSHFFSFILFTFGFSSGFLAAMIPLWKMVMEWSFYFQALMLVTTTGFYVIFCVILNEKLPNFTLGNILDFLVVWLLGYSLVFLEVATYAIISKASGQIVSSYCQ
ncbi:hypothetical protein ACSBR1_007246 [Camellia fascicularis]